MLALIFCFSGCDSKEITETIITRYGDELAVTAKKKNDMHEEYIYYSITCKNVSGNYFTYDRKSTALPKSLSKKIIEIINDDNIHIYSIIDGLFYIQDQKLLWLPDTYDVNSYLTNKDFADENKKQSFLAALSTLVRSKRLKYIQRFATILVYENDSETISLIQNWSSGIFTQEELQINADDGYSAEDLHQWADELLKASN